MLGNIRQLHPGWCKLNDSGSSRRLYLSYDLKSYSTVLPVYDKCTAEGLSGCELVTKPGVQKRDCYFDGTAACTFKGQQGEAAV